MVATSAQDLAQNLAQNLAAQLEVRRKLKADGKHSLADVARRFCGDVRLAPLVADLNEALPIAGVIKAGAVVVVPTKSEARAFAKKLGFTIGLDPNGENGTGAKKKWAKHAGLAATQRRTVSAAELARSLLERGVSPAETGKRVARLCPELTATELRALASATGATGAAGAAGAKSAVGAMAIVAGVAEGCRLHPTAVQRFALVRGLIESSLRPAGFRQLVDALARDAAGGARVLQSLAVMPALTQALVQDAPRVSALVTKARELAALERGARELAFGKLVKEGARDEERMVRALTTACADGVEALAGDRVALVGLAAEHEALVAHLKRIAEAVHQAESALSRVPLDVLRALTDTASDAHKQACARLPRPWPLLAQVTVAVATLAGEVSVVALDEGLAGLVPKPSRVSASAEDGSGSRPRPTISVAELQLRAAGCARAADEGAAFAERLGAHVVALFDLMRPPPALDGGAQQTRRARRRAAFDLAVTARGALTADGVRMTVVDAIERARGCGVKGADRLRAPQQAALEIACHEMLGAMSVARRPISELGRALVLVAMALDPEMAQGLVRPTGREAFVLAAQKHAGRVLSYAACQL